MTERRPPGRPAAGHAPPDVERDEEAFVARIDRIAEIDGQVDPALRRRGRIIADLVTVGVLAPVSIALDWHATRPLVMLALMGGGLLLNRLIPMFTERKLRREHDELLGPGRGGDHIHGE